MIKYSIIKNLLVFLFVYVPPLVIFIRFSRERNKSKIVLFLIAIFYMILSVFTNNLLPFILTAINIKYLRDANRSHNFYKDQCSLCLSKHNFKETISSRLSNDFIRFGFTRKKFNIVSAIKSAAFSYMVIFMISIIEKIIISMFSVQVKDQEVVTEMSNMPLNKFIILIPIIIIFAPVVEEFVFRWLIFEKIFIPRIGIYFSALISSVIFAFIHFNLKAFPLILWIGLYNCYLIEKKGYWYSVFNHFTFNLVTTMVLLAQKLPAI
ncbi:CPBP family intramembrane metalloprotease [Clostridium sp. P21]|uniref:CPBP family intramembrane metalloprotease n=1 Tax=Clostridium muellerianum TaxID=2716538 RepID=A0A7Y0EGV5_9CLOT|nr:CPBP family intramembrane glutamic endopeptidase [Clostridium muellerianum]NMM63215.1 CPBP family intramembrane metalloprotease [Clostridium muellerianum]